jgi:two-component system phosphate regulon sensor histidine kinase PhoR
MKHNVKLRLLSYGVIAYMILAFAWWAILLFVKNRDAFHAKRDLLRLGLAAAGEVSSNEAFFAHPSYLELYRAYRSQEWMIAGEVAVFTLTLIIGVWLINRGYNKEMLAAQQRRNFLLSITHELKSPIASIRLVLETLLQRRLNDGQIEKLTSSGIKETERLNELVNDLLLSAKLESAYQPYLERFDLGELLADIVQKLREKYPEAHITLDVAKNTVPFFDGDKTGMTSVVLNLLENAVKYSFDEPEIAVSLRRRNGALHLEVADQGIGIDDREKKKIFAKFYRVGNEDTRKTKGTGLGLYIVDQIVKAHRGSISVLDNQPRGVVFHIKLPAAEPARDTTPTPRTESAPPH